MSQNTNRVALRISAACLCAVLALVVARAHGSGEPREDGRAPAAASQCGGASSPEAMDAALADAKEQARQEQAASGQDSGWVVLNNRGYNYGAGPDVRVDLRLFEHEQRGATQD